LLVEVVQVGNVLRVTVEQGVEQIQGVVAGILQVEVDVGLVDFSWLLAVFFEHLLDRKVP
jgi:hypothetical protein